MNMIGFRTDIEEAYLESEIRLNNIDLLIERDIMNRDLATKATALKCMKEGADIEDFYTIESESSESFFTKAKNFFIKVYNTVKEFILSCIEKIQDYFQEKRAQSRLKKLKALCDKNPRIKSLRIPVIEFIIRDINSADAELGKMQARAAALADTYDSPIPRFFINAYGNVAQGTVRAANATGRGAAKALNVLKNVTITVGMVIAAVNRDFQILQKIRGQIKRIKDGTVSLFENAKKKVGEFVQNHPRINKILTIGRERLGLFRDAAKSLMQAIAKKISAAFNAVREYATNLKESGYKSGFKTVGNTSDKADTTNKETGTPEKIPTAGEAEKLDPVKESYLDDILADIYAESDNYLDDELDGLDF